MAAAKIKGRRRKQKRRKRHCQTRSSAGHPKRRQRKPNKKLYYTKSRFSIKRLNKILNSIEVVIHLPEAGAPFPKPPERMYSYYQFRPHKVKVTQEGYLKGGLLIFVFAWIDWSFLRDLAAPDYADSAEGGWLWDPVTLILLDFLRVSLHRDGRTDLLDELRDETPLGCQVDAWAVFNGCENAGQAGHGCQTCPLFAECQQVPFDLEGGVGHRVNPDNPKEVTPVFSHKVQSVVSFEVA